MNERLIPVRQTWAAILALALASLLSCAFVVVRAYYAGNAAHLFFFWNLFLAWVPVGAALVFYGLAARQSRRWILMLAAAVIWFLFFPNAPYIVTDIVHLRAAHPLSPAESSGGAIVIMSRPRGYFGLPRDIVLLDGKTPSDIKTGVPADSTTIVRLPKSQLGRPVVAMFNEERIVARTWPASQNRVAIAELTY